MKLKDYLTEKSISYSAFARIIRTSPETVRRYADGERIPTPEVMRRIVDETGNAVQPNDFYDLPDSARPGGVGGEPDRAPPTGGRPPRPTGESKGAVL